MFWKPHSWHIIQMIPTETQKPCLESFCLDELPGVLWPSAVLRVVVVLFATALHCCTKVEDIMCLWGNAWALCEQSPVKEALLSMRLLRSERNELPSINDWLLLLYFPEEMDSFETFNRALQSSKYVSLECKGFTNRDTGTYRRSLNTLRLQLLDYIWKSNQLLAHPGLIITSET